AERLGDFTGDLPSAANAKVSNYGSTPFTVYQPGTYNSKTSTGTAYANQTNSVPGCTSVGVNANNPTNKNCIPTSAEDAVAATILGGKNSAAVLPLPTVTPNGANVPLTWSGYYNSPTYENEYLAKFDQVLSDTDHIAATYFFVRTTQNAFGGGNIAPWTVNQSYTNQTNANISDVHTFSATTANQAWLSFTRAAGGRANLPTTNVGQLGSNYTIQGPSTLPDLNVSGYFHAQNSLAGPVTTSDFYSLRDMITMTKGKHTLV